MSAPEKVSVDTVQSDVSHLFHLLDAITDALMDMPYERDGKRDTGLDRIASLTWIARDRAEHLVSDIAENYSSLKYGREATQ